MYLRDLEQSRPISQHSRVFSFQDSCRQNWARMRNVRSLGGVSQRNEVRSGRVKAEVALGPCCGTSPFLARRPRLPLCVYRQGKFSPCRHRAQRSSRPLRGRCPLTLVAPPSTSPDTRSGTEHKTLISAIYPATEVKLASSLCWLMGVCGLRSQLKYTANTTVVNRSVVTSPDSFSSLKSTSSSFASEPTSGYARGGIVDCATGIFLYFWPKRKLLVGAVSRPSKAVSSRA